MGARTLEGVVDEGGQVIVGPMNATTVDRMCLALARHNDDIAATRAWAETFDPSILEMLEAYEMGEISEIDHGEGA